MRSVPIFEHVVEALLGLGGIAYVVIMLRYPSRAGIVPAIVAAVMLTTLAVQIVQGLRERRGAVGVEDDTPVSGEDEEHDGLLEGLQPDARRRLITVVLWSFLLFGLVQALGFVVGPAVGIVGLLLARREPPALVLMLGTGVGVGLFLLLEFVVLIPWNRAPLLELLGIG